MEEVLSLAESLYYLAIETFFLEESTHKEIEEDFIIDVCLEDAEASKCQQMGAKAIKIVVKVYYRDANDYCYSQVLVKGIHLNDGKKHSSMIQYLRSLQSFEIGGLLNFKGAFTSRPIKKITEGKNFDKFAEDTDLLEKFTRAARKSKNEIYGEQYRV